MSRGGGFEVGQRVRAARAGAGLSRKDLGRAIRSSTTLIGRVEAHGERAPTRKELEDIADACGVPDWFLKHGWAGWQESASFKIAFEAALRR